MQINISDVLSGNDACLQEEIVSSVKEMTILGSSYSVVDAGRISLCIKNKEKNHISLSLKNQRKLLIPCTRCLAPVEREFRISYEGDLDQNEPEEGTKVSWLEGSVLDLERLILEEILMQWPYQVLCKEDCLGLCPVCGADRNHALCNCDSGSKDPRMAVIQDIFRNH